MMASLHLLLRPPRPWDSFTMVVMSIAISRDSCRNGDRETHYANLFGLAVVNLKLSVLWSVQIQNCGFTDDVEKSRFVDSFNYKVWRYIASHRLISRRYFGKLEEIFFLDIFSILWLYTRKRRFHSAAAEYFCYYVCFIVKYIPTSYTILLNFRIHIARKYLVIADS